MFNTLVHRLSKTNKQQISSLKILQLIDQNPTLSKPQLYLLIDSIKDPAQQLHLKQQLVSFDIDNLKLINNYKLNKYIRHRTRTKARRFRLVMIGLTMMAGYQLLHWICKLYYLIEYDVNIDHPRVTDYHVYRFR